MNLHLPIDNEAQLRSALVERLRSMRAPPGTAGRYDHGRQLFSYCSLDRERLKAIELPSPIIGIILSGRKEVWLGDTPHLFEPGTVFVLPARVPMDVVNIPAGLTSSYESLLLEVPSLPSGVAPIFRNETIGGSDDGRTFRVPLNTDLVDSLVHAATAIWGQALDAIKTVRLLEVLTLLRPIAAARPLFETDLSQKVAWLIGSGPSEDWTVERVATRLGLGASTLRRRLSAEGTSFRAVVRSQRLQAAQTALASGASSLAAAEAAGYASRSHFARRYKESYGMSPTGRR
ncbi:MULTISPECIES: helix-turn-helix domain-containing protein [unclassified Rhizobium]|uniref:helix-turn-helix domain-containing protein n=1 Tax=unclassified Rhizobium TaxID=2613769 RepID=UPI0006FF6439|nr:MULTISPECIES: helix-turn-helix domain-containing protein [unclassified Rhizobium]KQV40791.1 AraC family transcriptional regulator [Rhizobium sp. Root1212]KRD36079.1 AraC family transcriptional regulator [Rhizobium sp. Root268]